MNGVIYARYSSHNQREESIEGQVRRCKEYANANGITIINEYCDRAISGKTDKREQFQKMIKDSAGGQFSCIIMYTVDRFARNRYDAAIYKAKLKQNGVRLLYTEQTVSDEPESIILESVLEGMAEYYSQNLARGVRRGMNENAEKCLRNGGVLPLGYVSVNGRYEIDTATAPIVEEIFTRYASGETIRDIVDAINGEGFRTRSGHKATYSTVSSVLRNERYRGVYKFADKAVEGGIPAIITQEMWDTCQKRIQLNKRRTSKVTENRFLLTGKLFCGHCGAPMLGESGTSHTGTIYYYYKCYCKKKQKQCDKKAERKDDIEQEVVRRTIEVFTPDVIHDVAGKVSEIVERERNDALAVDNLKANKKDVQKRIDNLIRLVESGLDTPDVRDKLLDLTAQKGDLEEQIAKAEVILPPIPAEKIEFFLRSVLHSGTPENESFAEKIIDILVNKVFVYDNPDGERIKIFYNITNQPAEKGSYVDGNRQPIQSHPNLYYVNRMVCLVV